MRLFRLGNVVAGCVPVAVCAGGALPHADGAIVPSNGLVGYWKGDGNAQDDSSFANHGVFGGAYTTGVFGQAFDLSAEKVHIPDIAAYSFSGDLSIGFWFNMQGRTTGAFIGQDEGSGPNPKWWIGYNLFVTNRLELFNYPASQVINPFLGDTLNLTQWNQLTLVRSGGDYSLYLNGVSQGTLSGDPLSDVHTELAFGLVEPSVSGFAGLMDDVVIYNRALSINEVSELAFIPEPGMFGALAALGGAGLLRRRPGRKAS